ncbi:hypothetical protein EC957_010592 [Mortierella hygrophila]|uniref:Uncharacterized protein n=1 Tax=Mortierella hygrophila TaxID=979708 RepID=A0A9P6F9W3_9FUNG|nr:hypothetical protein EC957_010592 [Mortierella hygrophila]
MTRQGINSPAAPNAAATALDSQELIETTTASLDALPCPIEASPLKSSLHSVSSLTDPASSDVFKSVVNGSMLSSRSPGSQSRGDNGTSIRSHFTQEQNLLSLLHGRGSKGESDIHEFLSHSVGRVVRCLGSPAWRAEESRISPSFRPEIKMKKLSLILRSMVHLNRLILCITSNGCLGRPEGVSPAASSVTLTASVLRLFLSFNVSPSAIEELFQDWTNSAFIQYFLKHFQSPEMTFKRPMVKWIRLGESFGEGMLQQLLDMP